MKPIKDVNSYSATPLIEVMIQDQIKMKEYIKANGTLKGFKSEHFKFAKPL